MGGFDEFMYELGVNMVTRKIANNLTPIQEIRMEEDDICIDTLTSFKNTKTKFKLGVAWDEYNNPCNQGGGYYYQGADSRRHHGIPHNQGGEGVHQGWQHHDTTADYTQQT